MGLIPFIGYAQEEPKTNVYGDDTLSAVKQILAKDTTYQNWISGEFTPGKGFDIVKTKFGSLNISGYGMVRWIDQIPNEDTYADNQGRTRGIKGRNDIYFHRGMIWLTGFLGIPRFRYNITVWGLGTTQQTLLFGNLQYMVGRGSKLVRGLVRILELGLCKVRFLTGTELTGS